MFSPPSFLRRVKEDFCRETARALVLREYQLRLNAELERSKLPFLWLKGLILAERLYGKFEARHCGDLDILVAQPQVSQAKEILGRLGFEPYHPPLPGQEFHPMAAHHTMWSLRLSGRTGGTPILPAAGGLSDDWFLIVELHHRLSGTHACQPAFDHLLHRSRTVDFHGQASRIPSIEDELLILSLHAYHHNYSLLRCLMDLAEYVKCFASQLNWPKLAGEARSRYWLGRLRAALEITDAVLGLDSADDIFSQIPALTPRQRWACRRLPLNALLDPASQSDDRRQAQLALLMDHWGDVFRLFAARILPAEEHVRMICPTFLAPYPALPRIYYFFHAVKRIFPGLA
jgi:hypothetical protein